MLIIGPVQVPLIENLTDSDLQSLVGKLLEFAKSRTSIDPEHVKLDFKERLSITSKHEVRKDFSSFANTGGGLIIVGIKDKTLDICGVGPDSYPPDDQLRQILSTEFLIRPPVKYYCRPAYYENKALVVYQIFESHVPPVEVYDERRGDWEVYERYGSIKRKMGRSEITLKWYRGAKKLPPHFQVDIASLGFYSVENVKQASYVKWIIKDQGNLYKWLQLMWTQLIPIPVPLIPFDSYSDFYRAIARWTGNHQELPTILMELENRIKDTHGIGFELWTVPEPGPRTFLEEHYYLTGCDAYSLKRCLADICDKQHLAIFGWILFAGSVIYTICGDVSESHCSIDINATMRFIPNNFPFVSLDDIGRVIVAALPVTKIQPGDIKKWEKPVDHGLFLEDVPDLHLSALPSGKIIGYIGQEPRPRTYDLPFRAEGLTVIDLVSHGDALAEAPPLIAKVAPLFCHVTSAPRGLNDTQEVRLTGLKCSVLPIPQYPMHDFSVILFEIECDLNQSRTFKLPAPDRERTT